MSKLSEPLGAPGLTRPYRNRFPSLCPESVSCEHIALDVAFHLQPPEFAVGFGQFSPVTRVSVPKTAVDKNCDAVLRKHNIGGSRQISSVQSKSVTETVEKRSNQDFLSRILVLYTRHNLASLLFGENVHPDRVSQKTTLNALPVRWPRSEEVGPRSRFDEQSGSSIP